jgi:hypothetical protein
MIKKLAASVLIVLLMGCPSQQSLGSFLTTLGDAAIQIANIEGDSTLALKLQTDTTAAVNAVNNWKKGTDDATVIEALNLVMDDLDIFPIQSNDKALLDVAILAVEGIVNSLPAPVAKVIASHRAATSTRPVPTGKQITSESEFKRAWNFQVRANDKPASLLLK